MDTRTPIHDALNAIEHPFDAFHRHHHDQADTAGTGNHPMSVLGDVKNFIGALDANPLISAIAERNLGITLNPREVTAVANFVRDLENAKRPEVVNSPPAPPQNPPGNAPQQQPVQRPIP